MCYERRSGDEIVIIPTYLYCIGFGGTAYWGYCDGGFAEGEQCGDGLRTAIESYY